MQDRGKSQHMYKVSTRSLLKRKCRLTVAKTVRLAQHAALKPSFTPRQIIVLHPILTNVEAIPPPLLPLGVVPFGPWPPLTLLARSVGGGVRGDDADNDVRGGGFGAPFTLPESRSSVWQNAQRSGSATR